MNIQQHFLELLKLLENNTVEYVIVGGYAVAFYGYPRFTKDIDIFFKNTDENIAKLRSSLIEFGFSEQDLPTEIFKEPGNILQFGLSPLQVDILNEIDGVTFDEVYNHLKRGHYGEIEVNFIGKAELIKNKKASARPQDLLDKDKLEKNQ